MWLLIAIFGYIFLALVSILDKFIVSNAKQKPVVYTFYSTIFTFGVFLFFPFVGWGLLSGIDWFWAVVSGLSFGFGLWTLFIAEEKGEASHISPFNGAMVTVFIYFLSSFALAEKLSSLQVGGMVILIFASLLLSFEKSRKYSGFHIGFFWAAVSGLFFALSHITAKYLYLIYPFWTGFVWSRVTTGILGLLLFLSPAVRQVLFKKKNKIKTKTKTGGKTVFGLIISNKVLSVISVVLLQYSMSLGSVTIVNALSGLQYVLMFVLIYLSTKFFPKIFKEYFTKREITVELIAIILVCIGSVFFVL